MLDRIHKNNNNEYSLRRTRLFRYIENFASKNWKISDKINWCFFFVFFLFFFFCFFFLFFFFVVFFISAKNIDCEYSKPCVRQPPLKLTLVVDVERWLSYKGTCHVILLAKLHDMYLYKTDTVLHINHYLKSVSKVALLHRFYCTR